jgi:aryl-alcohol dehydrogenase-like predicted oxidoreductase
MSIGRVWEGMGRMDKKSCFALLDEYSRLGGNFIDTANNYQAQESEQWIGEWMKERGNRDEMVIATKFTTYYKHSTAEKRVNYSGNHRKSLALSAKNSLANLQTDYIDLLYVHWWDWTTSVEEVMLGLNDLIKAGKVLYIGISDTPAWIVSKANQYARDHGLSQFVVYQGKWSLLDRDFEREIIPMCLNEGMALAPWGAVGAGMFQTSAQIEAREQAGEGLRWGAMQSEKEKMVSAALEKVGKAVGCDSVTAVALAYVMHKTPYVFPIVGGRKIEHLHDNMKALSISLSPELMAELEAVTCDFDLGFPSNFCGTDIAISHKVNWLSLHAADLAVVGGPEPIKPVPKK